MTVLLDPHAPFTDDPFSDPNVPPIRQSKFHIVQCEDASFVTDLLHKLYDAEKAGKNRRSEPGRRYSTDERYEEFDQLIDALICDEKTIDFIVFDVLTKDRGPLDNDMEREVRRLLMDASNWDCTKRRGTKSSDPHPSVYRHVDALQIPRDLRITYSPQISTNISPGWYEHKGGFPPRVDNIVKDGGGEFFNPLSYCPDAGSVVMWESSSGVHTTPAYDATMLEGMGGVREFLEITISFELLLERAAENVRAARACCDDPCMAIS